jgi:hypothetical protein
VRTASQGTFLVRKGSCSPELRCWGLIARRLHLVPGSASSGVALMGTLLDHRTGAVVDPSTTAVYPRAPARRRAKPAPHRRAVAS